VAASQSRGSQNVGGRGCPAGNYSADCGRARDMGAVPGIEESVQEIATVRRIPQMEGPSSSGDAFSLGA
jgi:hypothetical protein